MDKETKFDKCRYQMRLLKWSAIILPALFFMLIDVVWQGLPSDGSSPSEFILIHLVIAASIMTVSYFIFRFTSQLQKRLTQKEPTVVQEQEQIAREMHDGMAQVSGYINTQSLSDGRTTEAQEGLTGMEAITRLGEKHLNAATEMVLTHRELMVLQHVAHGATNKEISNSLHISENTVRYHMKNIFGKLHLRNRAEVVVWAFEHGLATEPIS